MAAETPTRRTGIFIILLFCLLRSCQSLFGKPEPFKREITVQLNPNASSQPPGGDLLHVRAVGENDTIHFLFCSQGAPTLLLVHTNSSSSTVKVNWTEFSSPALSGGLKVEPESSILYSDAIIFSRLFEYDDVNNTDDPTSDFFPPYELKDFTWSHIRLSGPKALLCGTNDFTTNGSLCLQLSVFGSEGRAETWPRLLHTPNSSQVEVWLNGLKPRATNSRFLLELQAVGGAYPFSRVEVQQSIDDEYTPSIFKTSQWVSASNGSSDIHGFVQWKPVAYRQSRPAIEDATPCRNSEPVSQRGEELTASSSLIRGFYSQPEAMGLNMSFGLAGDPFYNDTMFLKWTVLVGIGSPPTDSFSPLVIIIVVVGLGAPLVLLLLGGVCVCVHKKRKSSASAYEAINS